VALQLAVFDQLGHGALDHLVALAIDGGAQLGQALDERRRRHTKPRR